MPCALSPPYYRAHAFFVPLARSLHDRPAKRERRTERHWQGGREGKREREREGKRWGWLSPVLRDAHQSTQSHGRATATVSVKGIVSRSTQFAIFLSSASRKISPWSLPISTAHRTPPSRSDPPSDLPPSPPPAPIARAIRHPRSNRRLREAQSPEILPPKIAAVTPRVPAIRDRWHAASRGPSSRLLGPRAATLTRG